jgi:hypothetical protein
MNIDVQEHVDYARVFICSNLDKSESYLMVCEENYEYDMYDDDYAEDIYYNDDNIKKIYIDIGDTIIVRYYKDEDDDNYFSRHSNACFAGGILLEIDTEENIIHLKGGAVIDIDNIECIGIL